MRPEAQRAIDSWNQEVDTEMVRLIERGVPPHDATKRAQKHVSDKRSRRAAEIDSEDMRETIRRAGIGA